jgi:cell division protein FtsB
MILIFAALLTMCSREIVRLKAENLALQRQHAQLEQERDRLTKELGRVNDKEYIKQQARKQLRLLDPGEKMFIFEEKKDNDTDKTKIEEAEEAKGENPDG